MSDPQGNAGAEARASVTEFVNSSDPHLVRFFGGGHGITDEVVTVESALQVPAILAAVTFLSRTLAALPVKVYAKTETGREVKKGDPVHGLLNWAANDETSGFDFRRAFWQDVFTIGRGLAFVERNGRGQPINLWPLDVAKVTVERRQGRTLYHYQDGGRNVTYTAAEVLDLCFMPGADRLGGRSPIYSNAGTIGLAQAVTRYGARFFSNGGIPPFTISGPIKSAGGLARASNDLTAAVKEIAAAGGNALAVPDGHTLNPLGIDPEKMQMVDTQRFLVEQIARIYGLPPVFLQDLTHGTFSNTEQQDLHLSKHVIAPWCQALEGVTNLKFYGRQGGQVFAEHVLDGLMRGDLRTRAEATSQRINTGQLTINEAREIENRPPVPGGDTPLVQGAMVPANMAGQVFKLAETPAADDEGQNDE
ncbi:phage portal protein [Phaeobacter gallaeciensis]|uniref:phage portal protein n=1 Tax=Phaeobacter gallaeciensis TaxID=60890 RepID=UPI00237FCC54|nr:phage portal protein [Phaeobacter gallaeciensis]MDE4059763.1 phage portal protein [Phaeobacter gallaeciensis]MDE4122600.1 phage portal protein [Phaeobacter gallaeciensis]